MSSIKLIKIISNFVEKNPKDVFRIIIGTDSQSGKPNGRKVDINFITAIVIHRVGNGAKYFWRKQKVNMSPVLREKIYTETLISLEIANVLVPKIQKSLNGSKYHFEIHIDVGNAGPTREMIKEVVGMVNGNGYTAKTKPQAWGASTVADRYT